MVVVLSDFLTSGEFSFLAGLASEGAGEGGYAVPVGSSAQLDALPWVNIDQVRIAFSEDVRVAESDLAVYESL